MSDRVDWNRVNELNLTWVTEPPIVVLQPEQVAERVRALRKAMAGWDPVADPGALTAPGDVDQTDWQTPKRTMQGRWNARMGATAEMLMTMEIMEPSYEDYCVEYRVTGTPVGLMVLDLGGRPARIDDLLTHPGSGECGGILLEHAVQMAQSRLGDPRIRLYPLNGDARQAYLKLGFVDEKDKNMLLDPPNSDGMWTNATGLWRLARHAAHNRYIA